MSNYESTTQYLQGLADRSWNEARNNAGRIYSMPPGVTLREPNFAASNLQKPNIQPPPSIGDLLQTGDSTDSTLIFLDRETEKFIGKYFPAMNAGLRTVPDDVLCEIISGVRPYGLPNSVLELVWHSARDRAYRTANSEIRQIGAEFSARGFAIPPGAMIDAIAKSEQRATEAALEINVQQAIKDADIKLEMLQFAMKMAADYKTGIVGALADFYRSWISVPDKDIERARIRSQAMSSLYSALSSYYNVEISFEELKLRAAQLDAEIDLGVDRNRLTKQSNSSAAVSGLGAAVSTFGRIAEAASSGSGSLTAEIESI
jgi:hypothetical protein